MGSTNIWSRALDEEDGIPELDEDVDREEACRSDAAGKEVAVVANAFRGTWVDAVAVGVGAGCEIFDIIRFWKSA